MQHYLESSKQRAPGSEVTAGYPLPAAGLSPWQVAFIVILGLAIAVCEYVFAYHNVAYGIIMALALTIVIYLMLSIFHLDQRITNCGESLALIPLYILFTSSLPWFFINQQYLLPAVYSCILGLCLWHVYMKNLNLREIFGLEGLKVKKLQVRKSKGKGNEEPSNFMNLQTFKLVLVGLAIGIPLGTGEYFVLHPAPIFPSFEVKYLFRDMVYMIGFVGIGEELLFRGLIQRDLMAAFGWKWALFGASVMFAVMHLTWRSVPELGFVFIAGLILGGLYLKTKSLVAPIVAHGINNVMLVAVLPYLIS